MKATRLNNLIYKGRAKAAEHLGFYYFIYRPVLTTNPLSNKLTTIKAVFNSQDNAYKHPNMPQNAYWNGDYDGRLTIPGDYLIAKCKPDDIKFVVSQQSLLPIVLVDCNTSIKIVRASPHSTLGAGAYGGACGDNVVDVIGGGGGADDYYWPCSILLYGSKDGRSELPGGVTQAGYRVLLPVSLPVDIRASDIIIDNLGNRYVIQAAEKQEGGWRINATAEHL